MKTKNKSTSSTPATTESETPVTTAPYASTTSSSKPKVEGLLEMISIQDNKFDKLTKRVTNLEQMLCKAQSCNLIATNTSQLLNLEVDKLKQYSCRLCQVISGVELPPNKATKCTEETEEKVHRIIETNLDISREEFAYELDKKHRLLPNKKSSDKKKSTPKPPNIICKFRTNCFREYNFITRRIFLISLIIFMLASQNINQVFCIQHLCIEEHQWESKILLCRLTWKYENQISR